jgi:3-methyladenine DNA glycosylase/8-oxoguanine DNA glycosylase
MTEFDLRPCGLVEVLETLAMLGAHAVPGAEEHDPGAGCHSRLLSTREGPVRVDVQLLPDRVTVRTAVTDDLRLLELAGAVRRWLDLDAPTDQIAASLRRDPTLAPLVAMRPHLRVVGYPDGFEAVVMTVLGQQVSLAAGRTFGGRLVAALGSPTGTGLTAFPTPEQVLAISVDSLQSTIGVTHARARTLHAVASAFAAGLPLTGDQIRSGDGCSHCLGSACGPSTT